MSSPFALKRLREIKHSSFGLPRNGEELEVFPTPSKAGKVASLFLTVGLLTLLSRQRRQHAAPGFRVNFE